MARLIDADKIYDAIERRYQVSSGIEHRCERDFLDLICASDTVDAVEVVRCRDCTYWGDEDGKLQGSDGVLFARCKAHNYLIDGRHTGWCPSENDFCSYGERKDGNVDA